jgi:hypothetical protein
MKIVQEKKNENQVRFSGSATKGQMEQMQVLMKELRYSRSMVIRLAIELMLEVHQKDPKRYGV